MPGSQTELCAIAIASHGGGPGSPVKVRGFASLALAGTLVQPLHGWHHAGSRASAPAPPLSVPLKTHIILRSGTVYAVQVTSVVASASHTTFSHPTQEDLRRLSSHL